LTEARRDGQRRIIDDPTSLVENHEFITDCARYAEGLLSEQAVKKKHHFDDATWGRLGDDEALIQAIEAEKVSRTAGVASDNRGEQSKGRRRW
jgi:hypothetical protein